MKGLWNGMSSIMVCKEFNFLSIRVIESQLCLCISKNVSSNVSKILQKYLKNRFFPICYNQLWKKLKHLVKNIASSHQENKNLEKIHSFFPNGKFSKLEKSSKI